MSPGASAGLADEWSRQGNRPWLVIERLNASDAAGVVALYEPHAVLANPASRPVTGREANHAIYQQMADAGVKVARKTPLPTAHTATIPSVAGSASARAIRRAVTPLQVKAAGPRTSRSRVGRRLASHHAV